MSVDITVGSIVFGKSGKPLQVIAIEGDVLRVSGESGYMKVRRTAILKVEPPISVRQPIALLHLIWAIASNISAQIST